MIHFEQDLARVLATAPEWQYPIQYSMVIFDSVLNSLLLKTSSQEHTDSKSDL